MASINKCPYCNGKPKKILGRVMGQSSHLTYGWGERRYSCRSCGREFSVCYCIPPKTHAFLVKGHPGILEVGFKMGVSGYADPVVLTATGPEPKPRSEPAVEPTPPSEVVGI